MALDFQGDTVFELQMCGLRALHSIWKSRLRRPQDPVRVLECVACFSADHFCLAFAKNRAEERKLRIAFAHRINRNVIRRMSSVVKENLIKSSSKVAQK
jgi:hypothetical protein